MTDLYYETKQQPLYKLKDIYPNKIQHITKIKELEKKSKIDKFSYPITYALIRVLKQKIAPVKTQKKEYKLSLLIPNGDIPKIVYLPNNKEEWENWSLQKLNELKQKGLI